LGNKRKYGSAGLLFIPSALLYGGTYRPEDGILSFLIILEFLLSLLGILQLMDFIKARLKSFLDGLTDGLLPE